MKRDALIELYAPGIVVFDPVIFSDFIKNNGVIDSNIFEVFLRDENLGRAAVEQGVVCPIYQVSEQEYSVFIVGAMGGEVFLPTPKFSYSGFPLKVSSGVLIVSDLNALFDWDDDFFLNYKLRYGSRLPSNDYIEVESGLYSLTIKGYVGLSKPFSNFGYGLEMRLVQDLPIIGESSSVDDLDFELERW
ncbi:hypothetical protein [Pseudomonas fluorescens]|uniref:hypothetical protein n=1 Tax=Pseudomonas fluorescens TaxID=294 RepID=UPI0017864B2F|nr:hypothetical protein [Pseudomonas fluorescens]